MKFSFGLAKKASEAPAAAKPPAEKPRVFAGASTQEKQAEGEDLLEIVGDEFRTDGGIVETVAVIPCKNRLPNPRGRRDFEAEEGEEETLGSVEIVDGLNYVGRRRRERRSSAGEERRATAVSPSRKSDGKSDGDARERSSPRSTGEEATSEEAPRREAVGQLSESDADELRRKLGMVKSERSRNFEGSVPLLKRNREGLSGDLNRDLELLPDVDPMDHDAVPIEEFGDAMLRGMGYDPKKSKKEESLKNPEQTFRSLAGWRSAGLGTDVEMKQNKATLDTSAQKRRGKLV